MDLFFRLGRSPLPYILIIVILIIYVMCSGCMPSSASTPAPGNFKFYWEKIGYNTYRIIDTDLNTVCYWAGGTSISCLSLSSLKAEK